MWLFSVITISVRLRLLDRLAGRPETGPRDTRANPVPLLEETTIQAPLDM